MKRIIDKFQDWRSIIIQGVWFHAAIHCKEWMAAVKWMNPHGKTHSWEFHSWKQKLEGGINILYVNIAFRMLMPADGQPVLHVPFS